MDPQRSYKVEGIILKRANRGEADKILTVFTRSFGKRRVLAKSVRKINSRKGGNVELFNQVSLFIVKGKVLDIVIEATVINSFSSWRNDLKKIGVAYYLCELIDKMLMEEQENYQMYDLLLESLMSLNKAKLSELILSFEKKLLIDLGFGIPKGLETSCKSLLGYIEEITEKKINSPKIIREVW